MTEKEWDKLKSGAGPRENTLDTWAGYKPRQKEAAALAREVEKLGWQTVLKPVGSMPPGRLAHAGSKQPVFDLGGNAAEMVAASGGGGLPRGGYAVSSPDDRTAARTAPPTAYVGLRMAKGPLPSGGTAGGRGGN